MKIWALIYLLNDTDMLAYTMKIYYMHYNIITYNALSGWQYIIAVDFKMRVPLLTTNIHLYI